MTRPPSRGLLACYRPVTTDPICREPRLQRDGKPRIKVPGLADNVWLRQLAAALTATGAGL